MEHEQQAAAEVAKEPQRQEAAAADGNQKATAAAPQVFECEYDCGFRGTFSEVESHEALCTTRAAGGDVAAVAEATVATNSAAAEAGDAAEETVVQAVVQAAAAKVFCMYAASHVLHLVCMYVGVAEGGG